MSRTPDQETPEEARFAAWVRLAGDGLLPEPPRDLSARIRASLEAERAGASAWWAAWLSPARLAVLVPGLAVALVWVALRPSPIPGDESGVRVASLSGRAELLHETGGLRGTLAAGDPAGRGLVRLAEGSQLELDWSGRGKVALRGPGSFQVAGARIRLHAGEALASVKPGPEGFAIWTPWAEARVVGTVFRVEARRDATRVEVVEGRVEVRPADGSPARVLAAGESALTGPGLAPGDPGPRVARPAELATGQPVRVDPGAGPAAGAAQVPGGNGSAARVSVGSVAPARPEERAAAPVPELPPGGRSGSGDPGTGSPGSSVDSVEEGF